jgi:hypothetical protein
VPVGCLHRYDSVVQIRFPPHNGGIAWSGEVNEREATVPGISTFSSSFKSIYSVGVDCLVYTALGRLDVGPTKIQKQIGSKKNLDAFDRKSRAVHYSKKLMAL